MQVELTWTMSPDTCLFSKGAFREMRISARGEVLCNPFKANNSAYKYSLLHDRRPSGATLESATVLKEASEKATPSLSRSSITILVAPLFRPNLPKLHQEIVFAFQNLNHLLSIFARISAFARRAKTSA